MNITHEGKDYLQFPLHLPVLGNNKSIISTINACILAKFIVRIQCFDKKVENVTKVKVTLGRPIKVWTQFRSLSRCDLE